MTVNSRLMTADDLWQLPDDGMRHELVRGELRTMAPTGWGHGNQTSVLDGSLGAYVRAHRLGGVVTGEVGFRLQSDPDTVRAPDVAFVTRERLKNIGRPQGYFPGAPDLAVEVISPSDRYTDVEEKVAEWLEHGTRMVFVVNPRRQTVWVHRPGRAVDVLGLDDVLAGEDVVPGWSLPIRELFEQQ
ncbi:MAG: Uma2 family endonuclease [Chloroflexota bacterium]